MPPSAALPRRWALSTSCSAVGALIGTWNMAGTIPTIVYYGIALLQPSVFYLSALRHLRARRAVDRQLVDDRGDARRRARRAGAAARRVDRSITAGAVISGAYFGDKMTPISETTVLVPSMVGGVTTQQHIGAMIWTSVPSLIIAAVGFAILGFLGVGEAPPFDRPRPRQRSPASSTSACSTCCRWCC